VVVWPGCLPPAPLPEQPATGNLHGNEGCELPALKHPALRVMSRTATPIRLQVSDAERYARLRLRMLLGAPWAFAASPDDDRVLNASELASYLQDEQKALFAIEQPADSGRPGSPRSTGNDAELVAAAGIVRVSSPKLAHRAKVWGVYVDPEYRRLGFGRLVVAAVVGHARQWPGVDFVDLGVSENSPEAQRLYESLGFEMWGREPEAIECDGRRYDEIYMTLRLKPGVGFSR
jgi:ribosomal protein S18 acetylase RimI-like enzyme